MSRWKEYNRYDALGLAELIQTGQISAREVCEEAILRAQEINDTVNAINIPWYEQALNQADKARSEGPFNGVPFLVKDLSLHIKSMPLTNGSRALINTYKPAYDDALITRYRKAGFVFCGRTNTSEFGLMGVTEPVAYGPTRNPWKLTHTPGGSSGGAAAAVAAGIVPMASASDGGGSIRIPASACGLFGLKPSRGRTPSGPSRGEGWDGAAVAHVISRSVRDSAAMLDISCGYASGAPYGIEAPKQSFLSAVNQTPKPLKIAFNTKSPLGTAVDSEIIAVVEETALLLESMGHCVVEDIPAIDGQAIAKAYLTMYFGHVAADLRWLEDVIGAGASKNTEMTTQLLGLIGEALPASEFVERKRQWNEFSQAMAKFHDTYDIYMTPTKAMMPARIGELKPGRAEQLLIQSVLRLGTAKPLVAMGIIDKMATKNLSRTPFTQLANLTGQPAMSVPLGWSQNGLPIGVQFIAPYGDEVTLFKLAGSLENARPWFDKLPPI